MRISNNSFLKETELKEMSDENMAGVTGGLDNQIRFSNYSPIAPSYGFAPNCMRKIRLDSEGNVERDKSI